MNIESVIPGASSEDNKLPAGEGFKELDNWDPELLIGEEDRPPLNDEGLLKRFKSPTVMPVKEFDIENLNDVVRDIVRNNSREDVVGLIFDELLSQEFSKKKNNELIGGIIKALYNEGYNITPAQVEYEVNDFFDKPEKSVDLEKMGEIAAYYAVDQGEVSEKSEADYFIDNILSANIENEIRNKKSGVFNLSDAFNLSPDYFNKLNPKEREKAIDEAKRIIEDNDLKVIDDLDED